MFFVCGVSCVHNKEARVAVVVVVPPTDKGKRANDIGEIVPTFYCSNMEREFSLRNN